MNQINIESLKDETIYIGIDQHLKSWHVTLRTYDLLLKSQSIPATKEALSQLLAPYRGLRIRCVYEAGYFGYWLHDHLVQEGAECLVTPPSLIPVESGNRVKTDKKDSRKLAWFLSRDLLKGVYVPTPEQLGHRQVLRQRRQMVKDRIRVQNRIKAELRFYGISCAETTKKWSGALLKSLRKLSLADPQVQFTLQLQLAQLETLNQQIRQLTLALRRLAQLPCYKASCQLLQSIPGVGLLIAMEYLLELVDVSRFKRADQLAAYVGLTPSQYASAQTVRMGHITKTGKPQLRSSLIEASWMLIRKDAKMGQHYRQLLARCGSKKAIVAIARNLLLIARRMLIDQQSYRYELAAKAD